MCIRDRMEAEKKGQEPAPRVVQRLRLAHMRLGRLSWITRYWKPEHLHIIHQNVRERDLAFLRRDTWKGFKAASLSRLVSSTDKVKEIF